MSKVILKGFILVPEEDLPRVKAALPSHAQLTRAEPGCLCFSVTPNPSNPLRFDVFEEFVDKAAFEQHQQRVQASPWGAISQNVTRHYQIVE